MMSYFLSSPVKTIQNKGTSRSSMEGAGAGDSSPIRGGKRGKRMVSLWLLHVRRRFLQPESGLRRRQHHPLTGVSWKNKWCSALPNTNMHALGLFFCLGLVACSRYAEVSYQFQREQGTLPLLNISLSIVIYSWLVWTNTALNILGHDCKEEWYRTDHLKSRIYSSPCPPVWQCDCIPGFWADLVYLHNTFLCTVTH